MKTRGTNKTLIEAIVHGIEDTAPNMDLEIKAKMVRSIQRQLMDFINNKLGIMELKIEGIGEHMPAVSEAIFGTKKEEL